MKRILFILNALFFALLVHADDYTTVTHNFKTAMTPPRTMEILSGNKVGRMSDGTVYTCYGDATFTYDDKYGIGIQIPQGDSVIVSPPRERLSHMDIYHIPSRGGLKVSVSLDNTRWTTIPNDKLSRKTESIAVTPATLFGNYYVSLKDTASTAAYVRMIIYYSHPDCGCFPYIPEE